ncbi:MAG: biotin synthase, partial [Haliea sp.]
RWKATLEAALARHLVKGEDGRLALTFEVIYGHAFKPQPRVKVGPHSAVAADDMRRMLQGSRGRKA